MRINNITRARCYGFTITADGVMADGMSFHNTADSLIEILMAIVAHYAGYAVRWRFQSERGHQTHRLHFQGFIDFGCVVKVRTAMHWLPEGLYLSPVRDTPADIQRAADYCIKTDTRVDRPYSYGFNDGFDVDLTTRECESFNIGGSVVDRETAAADSDSISVDDWLDSVCDDDDSQSDTQSDTDTPADSDSVSFDDWLDSVFQDDDTQSDTQSDAKSEAPTANRQSDAQYDEDSIDAWLDDFWRELESHRGV